MTAINQHRINRRNKKDDLNEATFYDNDNGFVTVAKYKNGELQPIGQNSPKWLL